MKKSLKPLSCNILQNSCHERVRDIGKPQLTCSHPCPSDLISNTACITAESENKQWSPNPTNIPPMGAQNQFVPLQPPRDNPMSPGTSPWSNPAAAPSGPAMGVQAPPVPPQQLPRVTAGPPNLSVPVTAPLSPGPAGQAPPPPQQLPTVTPIPPSAPVHVVPPAPFNKPAAPPPSPAMGAQPPPVPQQLPRVAPTPPRPQVTPVPPSAPVRVTTQAPCGKPPVAPMSPAMGQRPSPQVQKPKTVTPPPPPAPAIERKQPSQNRAAAVAPPVRTGSSVPAPPRASNEKKSPQPAVAKPPNPVRKAESKSKVNVPSPGNKKGSNANVSPQPRARSSSAKRCVSDPILTPVTDEFPTEEWEGQWVAPKQIIVEERRKWPWKQEIGAGLQAKPTVQVQKPAPVSPAPAVVKKEQPRPQVVAAAQVQPPAPTKWKSVPMDLNAPSALSSAPKGAAPKRCFSDPIVTPVSDEFPTEDTGGQWVAPKQIVALERRHFVRRDDCLDGAPHRGDDRIISNPVVTPCTDEYPTLSEAEKEAFLKETAKAKEEVKPPPARPPAAPASAEVRKLTTAQPNTTVTAVSSDARSRPSKERTSVTQVPGSTEAPRSRGLSVSKEQLKKKAKRRSRRSRDTRRDKKEKSKGVIETITKILKPCSRRSHRPHSKNAAVKN
ncbi:hypothetical protein Y032_0172g349 [Ancylostoma ceylanicum]|uniref:Uncharacterized protein n=1 Tax=Ancylostoma ceylanicum TaxID=53326 RepID=A0A016SVE7_9BILA|nr:hypothetical protein Y032_0172g349 [Ancylostoma ceylanicum]